MDTAAATPTAIMDRLELILESFDGDNGQTLAQVTHRTGLPRSTVHRMLERLAAMRWLSRDGRVYVLGTKLMELGSLAVQQNHLHTAALPVLHELHRVTGHVVHLGILEGSDVVYLAKIGARGQVALESSVGGRINAHHSPIGRVLLAQGDHQVPQLTQIRDAGVAFVGAGAVHGIGAPVLRNGTAIAAISICAPHTALRLDHNSAAPVRIAAGAIMRHLGGGQIAPILQRRDQLRTMPTANPRAALLYA